LRQLPTIANIACKDNDFSEVRKISTIFIAVFLVLQNEKVEFLLLNKASELQEWGLCAVISSTVWHGAMVERNVANRWFLPCI
jgi:hypothetical protein